jgi:predicted nucleic acid-binding protein
MDNAHCDRITRAGLLAALPIGIDDETVGRCWADSLSIARQHNLSVYEAAYLELALRRGLPIASLDDKLKVAAEASGVATYRG